MTGTGPMTKRIVLIFTALVILISNYPAAAQQAGKPARIGLMRRDAPPPQYLAAFHKGLKELGHVEGKSYVLIPKWVKKRKNRRVLQG